MNKLGEFNIHTMATTSTYLNDNHCYTCSDDCSLSLVQIVKVQRHLEEGAIASKIANGKYINNYYSSNYLTTKMKDSID